LNSSSAAPERSTRTSLSLKENGATKTFSGSRDGGVGLKRATSLTLTEAHEANRKTQKTAEESRGRRDNKRRMQGVDCDERTRPVHEKLLLDCGSPDGMSVHFLLMYFVSETQKNACLKEFSFLAKAISTLPDV